MIEDTRDDAAGERDFVVCGVHGRTEPTFVCEHLSGGAVGRGFNTALNAVEERPDAWCDACDPILDEFPGWDDVPPDRHPGIRILCTHCYDAAKLRNELPDP